MDDATCAACGHDHAVDTTCATCGHHRKPLDATDAAATAPDARVERRDRRRRHPSCRADPIVEVIEKFLCLGAYEHTSRVDGLLACGIRTVMNVRARRVGGGGTARSRGTDDAR